MEGLGEAWRHELRGFGVDVVLVEPGAYRTDIFGRNRHLTRHVNDPDSPYAGLFRALEAWFMREVDRIARDPREAADSIVRILGKRRPALRHPIGAGARLRSLIVRVAPFCLVEWFFTWVFSRGAKLAALD